MPLYSLDNFVMHASHGQKEEPQKAIQEEKREKEK